MLGNNHYSSHLPHRVRGQSASQPASQLRIKFPADLAVEHRLTFNRAIDIRCMTSGAGPGPLAGLCLYPGNNDQSRLILKIELPDLTRLSFKVYY